MITTDISFEQYLKKFGLHIKPVVRVNCRFDPVAYSPEIPPEKAAEFIKIQRHEIENYSDLKTKLIGRQLYLPWYIPCNKNEPTANWDDTDVRHARFNHPNDVQCYNAKSNAKIKRLIKSFKTTGLKKRIEIVIAGSFYFNRYVIIDGCHRAIALAKVMQSNPEIINRSLAGPYKIYIYELDSQAIQVFFPCDFINFYNPRNRK